MRVLGATLGEWGREKYGLKPVKMDALEYLPEYLAHLRDLIKEEQAAARETNAPCAFVTFRCLLAFGAAVLLTFLPHAAYLARRTTNTRCNLFICSIIV